MCKGSVDNAVTVRKVTPNQGREYYSKEREGSPSSKMYHVESHTTFFLHYFALLKVM